MYKWSKINPTPPQLMFHSFLPLGYFHHYIVSFSPSTQDQVDAPAILSQLQGSATSSVIIQSNGMKPEKTARKEEGIYLSLKMLRKRKCSWVSALFLAYIFVKFNHHFDGVDSNEPHECPVCPVVQIRVQLKCKSWRLTSHLIAVVPTCLLHYKKICVICEHVEILINKHQYTILLQSFIRLWV